MGLRADLDRCGTTRLPPGFDRRTVQPVASRYKDWATRPNIILKELIKRGSGMLPLQHPVAIPEVRSKTNPSSGYVRPRFAAG